MANEYEPRKDRLSSFIDTLDQLTIKCIDNYYDTEDVLYKLYELNVTPGFIIVTGQTKEVSLKPQSIFQPEKINNQLCIHISYPIKGLPVVGEIYDEIHNLYAIKSVAVKIEYLNIWRGITSRINLALMEEYNPYKDPHIKMPIKNITDCVVGNIWEVGAVTATLANKKNDRNELLVYPTLNWYYSDHF